MNAKARNRRARGYRQTDVQCAASILALHKYCREPCCRRADQCRRPDAPCVVRFEPRWRGGLDKLHDLLAGHYDELTE